ncbi:MAG: hypothetical protein QM704_08750 [Anaeromyxobacteraceae bacterium]
MLTLLAALAVFAAPLPGRAALERGAARFAPVDLAVDLRALPPGERAALAKLVLAGRELDALYLRQAWAGNPGLVRALAGDASPLGRARLAAFLRSQGPWDALDGTPLVPGVPPARPPEASYYPAGATREEVDRWLATLEPAAREEAMGFFTVLRRTPAGGIAVVPYAVEYQPELARAAALLREAAALTGDAKLRRFLEARAAAFLSNDYQASDVAWMELDGAVDPTIGPYETYADGWFGAKAAFEAFIAVRDDAETAKLARFAAELQGIEDALPIDAALKNPKLGAMAPIRVVNELSCHGEASGGVQTAAYNLPNDDRIVKEKGAKRVMLKNVQRAKYDAVLVPIAKVALSPTDRANLAFDPFFTHILMHELVHGLGPNAIVLGGRATTVRAELQDLYGTLEEAKADVGGLFALAKLADEGKLDPSYARTLWPTYVAGMFRTLRFGTGDAHARGMALQMSWFEDAGAIRARPDGTFAVDAAKARAAATSLTREIMTIQGRGDRAAAKALLQKHAAIRPEVKRVLDRLGGVPVDVAPRFVTADALLAAP